MELIIGIILFVPIALTVWNIVITINLNKSKDKLVNKVIEVISIIIGFFYLLTYLSLANIEFKDWHVQLPDISEHSIIATDTLLTIQTILFVAVLGYILIRFISAEKLSPVLATLGIAAIYLGIVIGILWCIQTSSDIFLVIYPVNCILILIRTIIIFVLEKNNALQNGVTRTKFKKLSAFLDKATRLPLVALILAVPLLGIIIVILMLLGQEPDSIIKAWTETADWTMSQKIPPPSIPYDAHYLCTVAANGHKKVVKPLRTGVRHGHRVMVNRQLCIANAFEQVLQEKLPRFHKVVRNTYDSFGYPVSKHIKSKFTADIIYILMKPLEWLFLLVLYTVDVNPENRIAVQYPHKPVPKGE